MNDNKGKNPIEIIAMRLTQWIGSTSSIVAHTILFIVFFVLGFLGVPWDTILLVLTTVVSLEAIYLAIFIQMTVNRHSESLKEVESDIDELSEDVEDIQEDIEEISEDVEEITEDDKKDDARDAEHDLVLEDIQHGLRRLMDDIEKLKKG